MTLPVASASTQAQVSPRPWVLPEQALSVFYGCPQMPRLSHYFLPRTLSCGGRVLYVDGANRFDPLLLAQLARQRGYRVEEINRNARVVRSFTCFQLTETLSRVPSLLHRFPARILLVSGLPELYFDEDIGEHDADVSFHRALQHLKEFARQIGVGVFTDASSVATPRKRFFGQLQAAADQVWKFHSSEEGALSIAEEKSVRRLKEN